MRFLAPTRHQIPTLYHSNVSIDDPAACTILAVLDGTRDRDALAAVLPAAVRDEKIGINVDEVPLQDVEDPESVARQGVEDKLQKTLDLGLLISTEAA
ncbi:MAG: hypothetical protein ABGZ37_06025 [Akkermansiaceae bacterium]